MSGPSKALLSVMAGLVLLMVVRDPDQAHRPPDVRINVVEATGPLTV
ncbi:MAG: hypothetical protein AB7O56_09905 [Bauldia sp.]